VTVSKRWDGVEPFRQFLERAVAKEREAALLKLQRQRAKARKAKQEAR